MEGGDEIVIDGDFKVHMFKNTGNHTAIVNKNLNARVLIVAGGASGSGANPWHGSRGAGGGGAGGYRHFTSLNINQGTYTITVGAGGTYPSGTAFRGNNGGNSSAFGNTSTGGGAAGVGGGSNSSSGTALNKNGLTGGSGGGGGGEDGPAGSGTSGQGFAGGRNFGNISAGSGGGGGGGAGGVGQPNSGGVPGNGGPGVANDITGVSIIYSRGGRGSDRADIDRVNEPNNSGNGGEGARINRQPGRGGSGIVVVRYKFKKSLLNLTNDLNQVVKIGSSDELDYPLNYTLLNGNLNNSNLYLINSGFRGALSKFRVTSNTTDFSNNPLILEFILPKVKDSSKVLKLYKIDNSNNFINPELYPITLNWNSLTQGWWCNLPTLSDFILLDETPPNTILGGDPYIKNIKKDYVKLLPNYIKVLKLYESENYKVNCFCEKLSLDKMLNMHKIMKGYNINNEEIVKLDEKLIKPYIFNYITKIDIIKNNIYKMEIDLYTGEIIQSDLENIYYEEIETKNGLNNVADNYYYPKKNFKSYCIYLDDYILSIKVDNFWVELNNIKIYNIK
jgi:hypothetical protein